MRKQWEERERKWWDKRPPEVASILKSGLTDPDITGMGSTRLSVHFGGTDSDDSCEKSATLPIYVVKPVIAVILDTGSDENAISAELVGETGLCMDFSSSSSFLLLRTIRFLFSLLMGFLYPAAAPSQHSASLLKDWTQRRRFQSPSTSFRLLLFPQPWGGSLYRPQKPSRSTQSG